MLARFENIGGAPAAFIDDRIGGPADDDAGEPHRAGGVRAASDRDNVGIMGHDANSFERNAQPGSVYDLVFSPDKEQKFIYMIDAIKGEVRIVGRASNETLGRSGRLHVVGNEGGLDCAAADHPPTPQATIGLVQGSFRVTQRRRCLSRICSGPLSPRSALMCEQSGAIRCGAGGAKGGDQGECGLAKHAPDSEPGLRVTGAGPHAASICRSDSRPGEFSPVCPKGGLVEHQHSA